MGLRSDPGVFLILQLIHALTLRLYLGRWPIAYHDDPEALGFMIMDLLLGLGIWSLLLGPVIWLGAAPLVGLKRTMKWSTLSRQCVLLMLGCGFLVLFWWTDRTGYVRWFLD